MDEKSKIQRAVEGLLGLPIFFAVASLYHGWEVVPKGLDFWGRVGASFGHSVGILEHEVGGVFLVVPLVFWFLCLLYLVFALVLEAFGKWFASLE